MVTPEPDEHMSHVRAEAHLVPDRRGAGHGGQLGLVVLVHQARVARSKLSCAIVVADGDVGDGKGRQQGEFDGRIGVILQQAEGTVP
uniref:hypothetical protein n=1 Tax=Planotetraspora phitsanulokensis TaxID=575192 RepID=UPI00194E094E